MNLHAPNNIAATSTQHVLHRDYESRGVLKLEDVGAWKYAADPHTEILCCAYAVDNDPVKLWLPSDPPPPEFFEAAQNSDWETAAHNAQFEIALEHFILCRRYGFPKFPLSRQRCTMAMALACSLPPKLELAADALELIHRKDKAGQRLMLMLAKPRRPRKDEDPQSLLWFDDEERRQRLYDYAKKDLEAERELYQFVRPLSAEELELWQLDVRINARGFHVDRELAEGARAIAQSAAPELEAELTYITNGTVTSINQVARLKAWLAEQNCAVDTLDKTAVEELLRSSDLAAPVRRALELRQGGAQAAAKKITALLTHCGPDDRIRGAFRYHGASTGRWTGNGLQPQNLKHSTTEDLNAAIVAISTGNYAHVRNLYPQPLKVIGDLSRSLICAAPGRRFIGADLSSIESRVLAWVADEEWKLAREDGESRDRGNDYIMPHQRWPPLFARCARQDGSHQLSRCLTGGRSLAPELAKNIGRKWNIGNEQCSRSQPVGRNLLFQNADELAHAVPSLSGGEPRLAGYDTTVRGNQHVLHIAP
jgi:DNA polymerase